MLFIQPDGAHYAGLEGIREWYVELLANTPDGETLDCKTNSIFKQGDGTIVECGQWKNVSVNGKTQQQGNYVAVWREQNGHFQICQDVVLKN